MKIWFKGRQFDTDEKFESILPPKFWVNLWRKNSLSEIKAKNPHVYKYCGPINSSKGLMVLGFGINQGITLIDKEDPSAVDYLIVGWTEFNNKNIWEIYDKEKEVLNELKLLDHEDLF